MAQAAGVSLLDVAVLGFQEYHSYEEGYYPLMKDIIFRCGYRNHTGDAAIACHHDIILLHRKVLDLWVNMRTQQRGPSVERILEKGLPVFPTLTLLAVNATVEFYDKFQKTSVLFLLPLMAFDAVNLRMGFEALCPPGLGLPGYAKIAIALMEILPPLLPNNDSQIASLITVVRAESGNGYDLLWRVLELTVPGFDPATKVSAPVWMGEDIFDFCLAFVLYFRLLAKKGLVHDDRTKSITFLQAIREPAYVDVITTLHAHIDTFQSPDFGYLPPHLCMMGLATQMHKNAKARVWDIFPMAQRTQGFQNPSIQGCVPPHPYQMDTPKLFYTATTSDLSAMTLSRGSGQDDCRTVSASQQGCNQGRPREPTGCGRYARPDHNQRNWDPNVVCAACKRRCHPASKCDMLAMALFLDRYIKSFMTSAEKDKLESAWLQRWQERLGNPSRLPRKVMMTYLEEMDITPDVQDEQMEWDCWPMDDGVEKFEPPMDGNATAAF